MAEKPRKMVVCIAREGGSGPEPGDVWSREALVKAAEEYPGLVIQHREGRAELWRYFDPSEVVDSAGEKEE